LIRDIESNGERNRGMYVMKARGMGHSNQVREFTMSNSGLDLVDVYLSPEGVLTGSAREAHILNEQSGVDLKEHVLGHKDLEIFRKRQLLESEISRLQIEFESAEAELNKYQSEESLRLELQRANLQEMREKRINKPGKTTKAPKRSKE
jgi:circadian clock protein KaiC